MRSARRVLGILVAAWSIAVATGDVMTNSPIKELGEGRLQIGEVVLNSEERTLTFPARINMKEGMVEYLIVTTKGKVHESLLSTEVEPIHIHTGMLLLGVKAEATNEAAVFFDGKREIPGAKVKITVSLPNAAGKSTEIERMLIFAESKKPLTAGEIPHWVYNGSRFSETPELEPVASGSPPRAGSSKKEQQKVFMAQREGSIVSLIADPSALINNPRKDRENDELWLLNTAAIPVVGTVVEVILEVIR